MIVMYSLVIFVVILFALLLVRLLGPAGRVRGDSEMGLKKRSSRSHLSDPEAAVNDDPGSPHSVTYQKEYDVGQMKRAD